MKKKNNIMCFCVLPLLFLTCCAYILESAAVPREGRRARSPEPRDYQRANQRRSSPYVNPRFSGRGERRLSQGHSRWLDRYTSGSPPTLRPGERRTTGYISEYNLSQRKFAIAIGRGGPGNFVIVRLNDNTIIRRGTLQLSEHFLSGGGQNYGTRVTVTGMPYTPRGYTSPNVHVDARDIMILEVDRKLYYKLEGH